MRIFLPSAGGAIGRWLTPLLCAKGHEVVGTTPSSDKGPSNAVLGAEPVVIDVFNASALTRVVAAAKPEAVIHQLTNFAYAPGTSQYEECLARNACLRIKGTRKLVASAKGAGVAHMIEQSIALIYANG